MSFYEPQTAKKVYLYRNGTINTDAKLLVVNDRHVRDFSTFLNRVTSGIRAPVAVRNIYTPSQGHKVRSLEELVSGRYYVAGGSEQFKKVSYGSGPKLLPRRQQRVEVSPAHRVHPVVAESRYKRPVEKPFVIHVFRNGDERFRGVRVLLPRRIMASWDHILETVTDKAELYTPAKKLCTLDGQVVTELQDGGKYVAIEGSKTFKRVAYCATNCTGIQRRRHTTLTLPTVTRRHTKPPSHHHPLNNTITVPRPQPPPVNPMSTLVVPGRRKDRPMAGRKNKAAREKALLENRDDSVFGGSPVMRHFTPRMPSPPLSTVNLLPEVPAVHHTKHRMGEKRSLDGSLKEDNLDSDFKPANLEGVVEGGLQGARIEGTESETIGWNSGREKQGSGSPGGQILRNPPAPVTPIEASTPLAQVGFEQESGDKGQDTSLEDEGIGRHQFTQEMMEEEEEEMGEGEKGRGGVKSDDGVGRGGGREGEVGIEGEGEGEGKEGQEMDAIPEEGMERNVDQTDPEEVPEEEEQGGAERSEIKEDEEEAEMKVLPQDVELESDPLQTSVDLTVIRKQDQLANEGDNPIQSDPTDDVGPIETESRDVGSVKSGGEGEGGREEEGEREEREGEGEREGQGEGEGEGEREGKGHEEEGEVEERVGEGEEEEERERENLREGEAEVRELGSSHEELESEVGKEETGKEEDKEPATDSIGQEEGENGGGSEAEGGGGGGPSQTDISHNDDINEHSEQGGEQDGSITDAPPQVPQSPTHTSPHPPQQATPPPSQPRQPSPEHVFVIEDPPQ